MSLTGQLETFPTLPRTSAAGGKADAIGPKADLGARRSPVGGRPDVVATWPGSPFIAEAVENVPTLKRFETMIQKRGLH